MSYRFTNVNSRMGYNDVVNAVNRNFQALDKEGVTKVFKQANGQPSQIDGILPNKRNGTLYYDSSNNASILIGQAPDDGRMGIWVAKPGKDVLSTLGS